MKHLIDTAMLLASLILLSYFVTRMLCDIADTAKQQSRRPRR